MPTAIILDNSLSMLRLASPPLNGSTDSGISVDTELDSSKNPTLLDLSKTGIDLILEHLEHHYKLEHVALIVYSGEGREEALSQFDRDIPFIRQKLFDEGVEAQDLSHVLSGLNLAQQLVEQTWGTSVNVNMILVTDGGLSNMDPKRMPTFSFKGKLTVCCMSKPSDEYFIESKGLWEQILSKSGLETSILHPEGAISATSVKEMFRKVVDSQYQQYVGSLNFGDEMTAKITLCPPPCPYRAVNDFEIVEATISDGLDVKGFLTTADVASPPVVSRHLILPWLGHPATDEDSRNPSLCVFLHGALKVEGLCALVEVAPQWFGIIFSCADTKRKSSLMLALFEPGPEPVPWLGNLNELGPLAGLNETNQAPFPLKVVIKPSYSSTCVVWIKQSTLQSDVQKILRHARKLPDKSPHFYKELNRLKKAALCIGFHELLTGVSAIFEREISLLPASSHPECRIQLEHAAKELRSHKVLDVNFLLEPPKLY